MPKWVIGCTSSYVILSSGSARCSQVHCDKPLLIMRTFAGLITFCIKLVLILRTKYIINSYVCLQASHTSLADLAFYSSDVITCAIYFRLGDRILCFVSDPSLHNFTQRLVKYDYLIVKVGFLELRDISQLKLAISYSKNSWS